MLDLSRESILRDASIGRITPDEAEALAAERGWPPFATTPDDSAFDPMKETFWSPTMAIAWISRRDPAYVRAFWNDYRAKCTWWVAREWRDGPDGPTHPGYRPEPPPKANLALLKIAQSSERASFMPLVGPTAEQAEVELIRALRNGHVQAWGKKGNLGFSYFVQPSEWTTLVFVVEREVDVAKAGHDIAGKAAYERIDISREHVTTMWPPKGKHAPAVLPPLMLPDGEGLMPLFRAAHWIASKGGTVDFDPRDPTVWRAAYDALLGAAATGHLPITGLHEGRREALPPELFGSIQVDYPYGEHIPQEIYSGSEAYIRVYPFQDEALWFAGKDDSLVHGSAVIASRLMVPKGEVRARWPFAASPPPRSIDRTGAPGRPSSMHLVVVEFQRRQREGKTAPSLKAECEALEAWLKEAHSHAPPLTAKTIANKIRRDYQRESGPPK